MNDVFVAIRRAPYQSFATFFTLFLTLFLSLAVFFILTFLYGMLSYVESRPQVTVYFQTQTSESDILKIKEQLISSDKVQSVKYVSKNDAYALYKKLNQDNPLLLEMVTPDILPASLEIFAKKPTYLPEIAGFLQTMTGIDEVNFQKNIIDRLLSLTSVVRKTSILFFGYFIITTIIILISITHFKIALKKDEIELLQLIGASKFYIKKPFIKEAWFFGFISSSAVFIIFTGLFFLSQPFLQSYLSGIVNLSIDFGFYNLIIWPISLEFGALAFFITSFFGISISIVSTLLATQKYIK
ncbi:MAG: permease-like cell division protein FtsX [Patescibacteria group bacterium]